VSRRRGPAVTRTYRALKGLAWIVVSVFYRRIDVTGDPAFLEPGRPTVVVANHTNNLADPVVMLAKLPGHPRFLAAGSWWKFAPARWLFRLAGVVPIYRQRDGGGAGANRSTFDACHEALRDGATLALFPEGEVNAEPSLLPLKTGAARIALGAAADAGVAGVVMLPVGIVYEERGRFRSQAAVQVGRPVPVDAWVDRYRTDARAAIHGLTAEVEAGLRAVTVNHANWEDARLVDRAAALALADDAPGVRRFADRNELRRGLAAALADGEHRDTAAWRELADSVAQHDHDLETLGLDGGRAIPSQARIARERRLVGSELAVLAPVAAIGAVINAPVAIAIRGVAAAVREPSWQATAKGVAGLGLCPVVWGAEAFLVRRHGRRVVVGLLVAAPVGGMAWIAWRERRRQWRLLQREERLLVSRAEDVDAAASSRARVRNEVQVLVRDARPAPARLPG
jgi:glycerol-3-phosphate O-acyltransferase/dihydroxyacetone phosphate acyltransferase